MQEAKEIAAENAYEYSAHPLEDNLFEWHFTIRGPDGTDFEGGRYHGRILLPSEYPFKPPEIMFLTPNGRFELYKKICLSITGFHPEFWQPAWGIRTILLAVIAFFPTEAKGAIGGLDYTQAERRQLARRSREWICPDCQAHMNNVLTDTKRELKAEREDIPNIAINYKAEDESSSLTTSSSSKSRQPLSNTPSQDGSGWTGALIGILLPFLVIFIYRLFL
ncbi:UBC-like protein [Rhizopus microsporus]|uniref:UBC-like protein n=1 Tax=Rhizopus microsporus TaxID=58291 RepID=A0A1X0RQR5_RHIZD|nr:UBC-like protein [Rhizopus microsporus]